MIFINMKENSVQSSINTTTNLNTLKLLFNTQDLNNKILVIVEGADDKKVYAWHLSSETFYIYVYGTCDNYSKLVEELNREHHYDFFAIKDADFDILNNVEYSCDNLFLTDTHDLETMLIKDNEDFESKLRIEYDIDFSESFILKCIHWLSFLSYLKWYNNKHELKLNLKCISLGNIFNGNNPIDKEKCIEELHKDQENRGIFSDAHIQSLAEFISNNKEIDEWQLINGHDLCKAIAQFIKYNANKQVSHETISKLLRMNYAPEKFHETYLYKKIHNWISKHKAIRLEY